MHCMHTMGGGGGYNAKNSAEVQSEILDLCSGHKIDSG